MKKDSTIFPLLRIRIFPEEYVGYSASMYESHEIVNSGFKVDDTIKASTCDFIHSSYEPLLSNFMSDCQDALYMKEGDYELLG